jgi:hypothetical protein
VGVVLALLVVSAMATILTLQCRAFVKSRQLGVHASKLSASVTDSQRPSVTLAADKLKAGVGTFTARLKIQVQVVFSFWQVVGLLGSVYNVKYPPQYQRMLDNAKIFVTLGIQFGAGCLGFDFLDTMVCMTLVPLAIAAVLLSAGVKASGKGRKRVISVVVLLSYMVLPAVSSTIFQVSTLAAA